MTLSLSLSPQLTGNSSRACFLWSLPNGIFCLNSNWPHAFKITTCRVINTVFNFVCSPTLQSSSLELTSLERFDKVQSQILIRSILDFKFDVFKFCRADLTSDSYEFDRLNSTTVALRSYSGIKFSTTIIRLCMLGGRPARPLALPANSSSSYRPETLERRANCHW